MLAQEGIEVGAVDVDFAAYLREGNEALVAVVLPRFGEMPRISRTSSDSNQSLPGFPVRVFSTISMRRSSFSCSDCHSSCGIISMSDVGAEFC